MSERAPVCLTGATGMVGRIVLDLLRATGTPVVALARNAQVARRARPDVTWFEGDLGRPESLAGLCAGCEHVLHVAGSMPADAEDCLRINRDGTRALLEEARAAGARRFVLVSSVAVYGDRDLISITESAARAGEGPYARAKCAAEDALFAALDRSELEGVVLRPCPILGVGAGHFAAGVRALVHLPEVPLIDDGARRVDLVAARDVAAMVVAARHMPARGGPTAFHLSSCPALTIREILALAAEAAGTTPRLQPVPLAHALASNARAAGAGAPPPFPPALLAYAMFERTYDSALARQHLGFAPTDARRALLEAVRLSA